MRVFQAPVVENLSVGTGLFLMAIRNSDATRDARPGQFLHVRCARPGGYDPLLRRPISIYRIEGDLLWLYYDVVGCGTAFLGGLRVGDMLDVLGPLGQPFRIEPSTRQLLMVAGGIGLAPLVALADLAVARDLAVTILAGFRDHTRVLDGQFIPPQVEYVVSTDDGSFGHPGRITNFVGQYLGWADQIFGCGPTPMLEALGRETRETTKTVQISLEERMACGMGVCLSCAVRTRTGVKRVCRDGPVFDLADLKEFQWRTRLPLTQLK